MAVFVCSSVYVCPCSSLLKRGSARCVYKKEIEFSMCSNLTLAGSGADVGDEASSAGVWLGGALLTGVAPRSTNGGAAEGFGTDDSTELALTHLVVHLSETWPSPVVCG